MVKKSVEKNPSHQKEITVGILIILVGLVVFTTALAGSLTGASIFGAKPIKLTDTNSGVKDFTNKRVFGTYETVQIKAGCELIDLRSNPGRLLFNLPFGSTGHTYCAAKGYDSCSFIQWANYTTSLPTNLPLFTASCGNFLSCGSPNSNGICQVNIRGIGLATSTTFINCCNAG